MLNNTSTNTDPWGIIHRWSLLGHWDIYCNLWVPPSSQFLTQSSSSIKAMSPQFRNKDDEYNSVKFSAHVQVNDIGHSFLIHQHHNPIAEDILNWQAWFSLGEAMLTVINHILIFLSFQDDLPCGLAKHWGKTDLLWFPQYSLFSFLKMRLTFLLFLSVGTSLYCHDFSNMMNSYIATSTSSFWISGYI